MVIVRCILIGNRPRMQPISGRDSKGKDIDGNLFVSCPYAIRVPGALYSIRSADFHLVPATPAKIGSYSGKTGMTML